MSTSILNIKTEYQNEIRLMSFEFRTAIQKNEVKLNSSVQFDNEMVSNHAE